MKGLNPQTLSPLSSASPFPSSIQIQARRQRARGRAGVPRKLQGAFPEQKKTCLAPPPPLSTSYLVWNDTAPPLPLTTCHFRSRSYAVVSVTLRLRRRSLWDPSTPPPPITVRVVSTALDRSTALPWNHSPRLPLAPRPILRLVRTLICILFLFSFFSIGFVCMYHFFFSSFKYNLLNFLLSDKLGIYLSVFFPLKKKSFCLVYWGINGHGMSMLLFHNFNF